MIINENPTFTVNTNKLNMDIWEMAYAKIDKDWKSQPTKSSFTRIYMMLDGEAVIKSSKKKLHMKPGNVYIIPAGMSFSYYCDVFAEKIYMHISVLLPNNYDIFNDFHDFIVIEKQYNEIQAINTLINSGTVLGALKIKTYIYQIISECLAGYNRELHSYSDTVSSAVAYIEENLHSGLSVDTIADAVFVSVSKLQKSFKKELGVSIGKYMNDRLMFAAEKAVRAGNLSIKEISDMFGFCDRFYFSRIFKKKYGISPLKYRKMCRF